MKKVLLAIAAVATITSCSQNEKLMILEHLEHLVMLLIVSSEYGITTAGTKILDGTFNSTDEIMERRW